MLPVSHQYHTPYVIKIKIKAIFYTFRFRENSGTTPPNIKIVYILKCGLFDFWTFSTLCDIFLCFGNEASRDRFVGRSVGWSVCSTQISKKFQK